MYTKLMESRWNNALAFATEVNRIIDNGGMVFDEGNIVVFRILITDKKISIIYAGDGARFIIFDKDINMDEGLYTPIGKWNNMFKNWRYIDPTSIKQLAWGKR